MIKKRRSQDIDAVASYSVEEEGESEGYYFGLVGGILKYMMTILCGLLLVATQSVPEKALFVFMITVFYVVGWVMTYEAGMKTFSAYDTVLDAILYGLLVGFLVRVVEGLVLQATAGIGDMNSLAPWEAFLNSSTTLGSGLAYVLAGLIFAAVGEEMLHRGGMIYLAELLDSKKGLGDYSSKILALVVTSISFALLHSAVYNQLQQIVALFAGGLVLGLSLYWKHDMTVPIIAHLTVNISPLLPYFGQYLMENPMIALSLALVGGLIFLLYMCSGGDKDE